MNLNYIQKLGFKIWKINIKAQKIDDFILKTFEIVIANFLIKKKIDKVWYF